MKIIVLHIELYVFIGCVFVVLIPTIILLSIVNPNFKIKNKK